VIDGDGLLSFSTLIGGVLPLLAVDDDDREEPDLLSVVLSVSSARELSLVLLP
jgi:hypothetical protein